MNSISSAFDAAARAIQAAQERFASGAAKVLDPALDAPVEGIMEMGLAGYQLQAGALMLRSQNQALGALLDIVV